MKKICYHMLKKIDDPVYRYQCVKCKLKLKIASGIVIEPKGGKMNALPIVKLFFDAEQQAYDDETGTEKRYYADLRLREYRSIDGSEPWIVKECEVGAAMEDIIEQYEVKEEVK